MKTESSRTFGLVIGEVWEEDGAGVFLYGSQKNEEEKEKLLPLISNN